VSWRAGVPSERRLSRRRFVGIVAAGSVGALASAVTPPDAATAKRSRRKAAAGASVKPAPAAGAARSSAPEPSAAEKEFERQKKSTLGTLKTIRDYPLPPGGDLSLVFRPLRAARKAR